MNRILMASIFMFYCFRLSWAQDIKLAYPGVPIGVESFFSEVATKSRSSGSLVERGTCMDNDGIVALLKSPPEGPFHDMKDALNSLVRADTYLTWSKEADGQFRVRDSRVLEDVLGIHLHEFRIDNAQGIDEAIDQLINAPEVKEFYAKKSIEKGFFFNHLMGYRTDLPRYTVYWREITFEAALDRIVTFYPGVWIYSECSTGSKRRVLIRGIPVRWPEKGNPSNLHTIR